MAVKMRPNYCRTKRPRGALLQLDIEGLKRIVENRWESSDVSEIPLFYLCFSHQNMLQTHIGTVSGG